MLSSFFSNLPFTFVITTILLSQSIALTESNVTFELPPLASLHYLLAAIPRYSCTSAMIHISCLIFVVGHTDIIQFLY